MRPIYNGNSIVGLWVKRDAQQNTVDEIVVKEQDYRSGVRLNIDVGRQTGIEREALVQVAAQQKDRVRLREEEGKRDLNIVHLRQYKFHDGNQMARFYLIHAPHGTFADLQKSYALLGQALPEAFLWQVLRQLSEACKTLDGPFHRDAFFYEVDANHWAQDDSFIHTDIKHQNVVLDYAPIDDAELERLYSGDSEHLVGDMTMMYPVAKLSDFGLVAFFRQGRTDGALLGTPGWVPAEIDPSRWGSQFAEPPNFPKLTGPDYDSRFEVWGIGKIVLDAAMGWREDVLSNELRSCTEADYNLSGHFLPADYDRVPGRPPTYTPELMTLLRDCVHPSADARPSLTDLIDRTTVWLQEWDGGLRAEPDRAGEHRLYFRGAEVDELAGQRGQVFRADINYHNYLEQVYRDPEHPLLNIPAPRRAALDINEQGVRGDPKPKQRPLAISHHEDHTWFTPHADRPQVQSPVADDDDSDDDGDEVQQDIQDNAAPEEEDDDDSDLPPDSPDERRLTEEWEQRGLSIFRLRQLVRDTAVAKNELLPRLGGPGATKVSLIAWLVRRNVPIPAPE